MRLSIIFLALTLSVSTSFGWSDSYKVSFRHFPDTLSPIDNSRLAGSFLLWQLVNPFFYFGDSKELNSKILNMSTTRATSKSFDEFVFCLKPNLKFSSGETTTEKDLKEALERLKKSVEGFSHISSAKVTEKNCVKVNLTQRDFRFFEKMTGVSASLFHFNPSKPLDLDSVGDYRIKSVGTDTIVLSANESIKAQTTFKTIILKLYDPTDTWTDFDLNFVSGIVPSPAKADNFQEIIPPIKKMYSIVINLKSEKMRKCFASILEPEELKRVLEIETKEMHGFIPSEMLGANEKFVPERKPSKYCTSDMRFTWHDFRDSRKEQINKYFESLGRKNNVTFKIEIHPLEELIKLSESGKEYITAISFNSSGSKDAWNSDSSVFFEPFVRRPGFFIFPVPELSFMVKKAATEDEVSVKTTFLKKAHRLLLDSGFVYPLGEVKKNFFYPKTFRTIPWADRVSGIPLISEIK